MIGLCCQYIEKQISRTGKENIVNIVDEKSLQYNQFLKGNYSSEKIESVWAHNATNLLNILQRIHNEGFKSFRVSSNLFPLYDCVPQLLHDNELIISALKKIGEFVIENKMRLTTHPDQFVVLSSDKQRVIDNSINILKHHAWIFDQMKLPNTTYYAINIHGGAKGRENILIESIKKLPESVKNRLTLENDERSYNVIDLLRVFNETDVPICWDSHHHSFNDGGLNAEKGLEIAKSTWKDQKPLTHLSNTNPLLTNGSFTERRKHSDFVHYIPECQIAANNSNEIDIDFEFKMKNLAIIKAVNDFEIEL